MKITKGQLIKIIQEEARVLSAKMLQEKKESNHPADYFVPGDHILFGKWKNKRGIIVGMWEDADGYPVVEIEPQPKGRKDNVIMGLFKIRRDIREPLSR